MVVRQPRPSFQGRTPTVAALTTALAQFDAAADRLHLDEGTRAVLRACKRELAVHFPARMDDGSIRVFTGYRVQHNLARGPAQGGLRYPPPPPPPPPRPPRRLPGRGARPGHVDDLEERRGEPPLRGRQGRRHRRSQGALP